MTTKQTCASFSIRVLLCSAEAAKRRRKCSEAMHPLIELCAAAPKAAPAATTARRTLVGKRACNSNHSTPSGQTSTGLFYLQRSHAPAFIASNSRREDMYKMKQTKSRGVHIPNMLSSFRLHQTWGKYQMKLAGGGFSRCVHPSEGRANQRRI